MACANECGLETRARPGRRAGSPVHWGVTGLENGGAWVEGTPGVWQTLSAELRCLPGEGSRDRNLSRGAPDSMCARTSPSGWGNVSIPGLCGPLG